MPTRNPFAAKAANPFAANPLTMLEEPKLLDVPQAPTEIEPRTPLKTYLTRGGGGGLDGLFDALGGGGPRRKAMGAPSTPRPAEENADLAATDPLEEDNTVPPAPAAGGGALPKWGRR